MDEFMDCTKCNPWSDPTESGVTLHRVIGAANNEVVGKQPKVVSMFRRNIFNPVGIELKTLFSTIKTLCVLKIWNFVSNLKQPLVVSRAPFRCSAAPLTRCRCVLTDTLHGLHFVQSMTSSPYRGRMFPPFEGREVAIGSYRIHCFLRILQILQKQWSTYRCLR